MTRERRMQDSGPLTSRLSNVAIDGTGHGSKNAAYMFGWPRCRCLDWLARRFKSGGSLTIPNSNSLMSEEKVKDSFLETPGGRSLAWLADAPMFIDGEQVSALYNAVAKPEHETGKITLSLKDKKQFQVEGKVSAEVEAGLAPWLKTIFPFLDAKGKVGGEVKAGGEMDKEKGSEIELLPIDTPQRQLVQLALHYLITLPHRTRVVGSLDQTDWLEESFYRALPRGLVFVEFPPETKFVPMATEVEAGGVQIIYSDLMKAFVGPKEKIPTYPEPAYCKDKPEELAEMRRSYWGFFREHFSSTLAMEAVEKKVAQGGGLVHWIDYRVPLGDGMPYLHLSVCGHGRYDTGTFAYRLVKRGFKHGLRMVGTMKSEPAMNVLAIF